MYKTIIVILAFQFLIFLRLIIKVFRNHDNYSKDLQIPLIFKVLLSVSCIICALNVYKFDKSFYSILILVGMWFSFLGDLAMAGVLGFKERLIGGMKLFGLAHIWYFLGYIVTMYSMKKFNLQVIIINVIILMLFVVICNNYVKEMFKNNMNLFNSGVIYGVLILNMCMNSFFLAFLSQWQYIFTFIGGVLFVISDGIIAAKEFYPYSMKNCGLLIWMTYILGQMCIICSPLLN